MCLEDIIPNTTGYEFLLKSGNIPRKGLEGREAFFARKRKE
jgi:hypothetical protein